MSRAEKQCLHEWRIELLKRLKGYVLEIGAGTGANISAYPTNIEQLLLLEPNQMMHKQLKHNMQASGLKSISLLSAQAECVPLPDGSVDAVVSTLVLCSVNNLEKTLGEIHRLLKPGGNLFFIEHIASTNNPIRYRWQRRLEWFWKKLADGCHVTRNTEQAIRHAGFCITELKHESIRGVPGIVRPSIRGIAVKS